MDANGERSARAIADGTTNGGSRRRAFLEMLVCVLLVAALAGQPAWGGGNGKNRAHAPAAVARVADGKTNSDPTPAPADEPRPVDIPAGAAAQQEEGAGTTARPPKTYESAPDSAAPAQSENASRRSSDEVSSRASVGTGSLAQKETPARASGVQPPTTVTPPPVDPSAAPPPAGDTPQPPATQDDTQPVPPGTPTPLGPPPTGDSLRDGPVLQVPAREITQENSAQENSGTSASRPRSDGGAAVGRLSESSSVGLEQVANLVKDIPPWIKIALAGLAALVVALGAYTVLAAARTRRLERQRSKLMEDIGLLQAALLPTVPGRLGALLTTVAYRPADGPAAGGDFYDAFALSDGRVGLLLGDISGHGRQALAKTTLVRFTVRAHLEAGLSPREALSISGRSLDGGLSDDFSTVIAAIHDPVKGTLTYASAGHPTPLVIGPPAHEPVTASSAPPIGAGFPTGQRQTVLPMPEGSTVAVFSDGLIEARIDGETLGRDRLGEWLAELGPEATAKALLDLVVQRADRVPDDLAAVVLHAAPGASAPAARIEQLKLDVLDVEGPELEGFLKASGVTRADRAIASRRVAEQLAVSGGVVVEVRIGEHPMVSVAAIGDHAAGGTRFSSRAR